MKKPPKYLQLRVVAALRGRQQGAATLIVVMILFFIMAMMAAYANRNLIFEQRIAGNYYRSGVAFEAADAGVEWTLAMLNGINTDQNCNSGAGATNTFRQRYLTFDPTTHIVNGPPGSGFDSPAAACVRGNTGWNCGCPTAQPWSQAVGVTGSSSFQVGMTTGGQSGLIEIQSMGCSSSNPANCRLANEAAAIAQMLGASRVKIKAALVSALKSPPAMPLAVLGNVVDGAGFVGLHNSDPLGNGILLLAGGTATLADSRLDSVPGTPVQQALITSDPALTAMAATPLALFSRVFGMSPASYQTQPAVRIPTSCTNACVDTDITQAVNAGAYVIWINGTLTLTGNSTIGSATSPVLIIATGDITLNGSLTINGVLYSGGNISAGAQAVVNGAVIGEGNFTASGLVDINYQPTTLNTISNTMGSFVRVPGSWWEGL